MSVLLHTPGNTGLWAAQDMTNQNLPSTANQTLLRTDSYC